MNKMFFNTSTKITGTAEQQKKEKKQTEVQNCAYLHMEIHKYITKMNGLIVSALSDMVKSFYVIEDKYQQGALMGPKI